VAIINAAVLVLFPNRACRHKRSADMNRRRWNVAQSGAMARLKKRAAKTRDSLKNPIALDQDKKVVIRHESAICRACIASTCRWDWHPEYGQLGFVELTIYMHCTYVEIVQVFPVHVDVSTRTIASGKCPYALEKLFEKQT
jgi:hypothetical protein